MSLQQLIDAAAQRLRQAGVSFGHGTTNAYDEAAWLVLWRLGLALDTQPGSQHVTPEQVAAVQSLIEQRISTRKPAAYLTREAWLQGFGFYVDERVIVPRSLIAELLVGGTLDYWLHESTLDVLDLCTGNGSLAIIAAQVFPEVRIDGADLSADALAVAHINLHRYGLQDRVRLRQSDGFNSLRTATGIASTYDLIVCNPPYVNAQSMTALPPEYLAEPRMALDGNTAGGIDGMDFIRTLMRQASKHLNAKGVLVLEIGNERPFFETAFGHLDTVWLETSAGEDQVLLMTREALPP